MYPVTVAGRLCAGIIAVLGIGMFALPTGILGAGFVEEIQKSTLLMARVSMRTAWTVGFITPD